LALGNFGKNVFPLMLQEKYKLNKKKLQALVSKRFFFFVLGEKNPRSRRVFIVFIF